MQFSDTTNQNGLIQDCETLLDMSFGDISGSPNTLKKFTNLINQAYEKAAALIISASSQWDFDDSNYTDTPVATTDLVDSQQTYALPPASASQTSPTTLLRLIRVEIKDAAGNWKKITALDAQKIEGIGLASFMSTAGMPQFYRVMGNVVELYPKPLAASVTLTAGLKVYFQRTVSEFLSTDTTKTPGLAAPFHRFLSLQASLDFAGLKAQPQQEYLKAQRDEILAALKDFYSGRNRDDRPKVSPRTTNYT